jgi:antitoxin (DNA-binding transcriptional repressor) of toxin-antitoxin stability system
MAGTKHVGVREFRGNMTGYLRQVQQGASFLITSHGAVLAELRPPAGTTPPARVPGALRGKISMAADFDTLPPDIMAAIEAG